MVLPKERRKNKRADYETAVALESLEAGAPLVAKMFNFSRGGLYFESDSFISPGKEVFLGISKSPYSQDPSTYECHRVKVKWMKELYDSPYRYGYGVEHRDTVECLSVDADESDINGKVLQVERADKSADTRKHPRKALARPVYFVPGTKTVGELFSEMRAEGYLVSIVVDEYGGSSGIVSIDQLIEEIVGEVKEEIVGAKTEYKVVGERTFRIQGSMKIEEANEKLGLDLPEGEYKTIGGFALNLFGHLPSEGEQIIYENLRLVVAQIKDNKIARLFVTKEKESADQLEADVQDNDATEECESNEEKS